MSHTIHHSNGSTEVHFFGKMETDLKTPYNLKKYRAVKPRGKSMWWVVATHRVLIGLNGEIQCDVLKGKTMTSHSDLLGVQNKSFVTGTIKVKFEDPDRNATIYIL